MFEVRGKMGVIIDENAFNVALVHSQNLELPKDINNRDFRFDTMSYMGDDADGGVVLDIDIPEHIKHPLVGISFKYGVGYAQLSFRKNNKRIARVFIAIHRREFLKHYPQYAHNSSYDALLIDVFKKEPFKILFFDVNPPIRKTGIGLEIFNSKGEIIYDSDMPTLAFPIDIYKNADSYRSIIICQSFYPVGLVLDNNLYYPPIRMILDKRHFPILFMGSRTHGVSEMLHLLQRIDKKYMNGVHDFVADYVPRLSEFHDRAGSFLASY